MDTSPNSNAAPGAKTPFQKFQALASALMQVPKGELAKANKGKKPRKKK
jgi:hypothetical protein